MLLQHFLIKQLHGISYYYFIILSLKLPPANYKNQQFYLYPLLVYGIMIKFLNSCDLFISERRIFVMLKSDIHPIFNSMYASNHSACGLFQITLITDLFIVMYIMQSPARRVNPQAAVQYNSNIIIFIHLYRAKLHTFLSTL